jgi:hypothetical protein
MVSRLLEFLYEDFANLSGGTRSFSVLGFVGKAETVDALDQIRSGLEAAEKSLPQPGLFVR